MEEYSKLPGKTRGLKDFYLPPKIAFHFKIIFWCAIWAPIWALITKNFHKDFIVATFTVMIPIMEIMILTSKRIFKEDAIKFNDDIKSYTKKYIGGLLLFMLYIIFVGLAAIIIYMTTIFLVKGQGFPDFNDPKIYKAILYALKAMLIGVTVIFPINFFKEWQKSMKRELNLKEENLIFQNQTLKNQINPHFLFNSLNTLSSLVSSQPHKAEEFINKLSSIYRYILDNYRNDSIRLQEEINFIKEYFSLHQIRDENKIQLQVKDDDYSNYSILPVSIQMLIENALKHNMASIGSPLIISIYIEGEYIVVKNNLQKKSTQLTSTKTGLHNLSERYKLTSGKEVVIIENDMEFIVKLPLMKEQ